MGTRPVSNGSSGEPGKVPDDLVNTHLGSGSLRGHRRDYLRRPACIMSRGTVPKMALNQLCHHVRDCSPLVEGMPLQTVDDSSVHPQIERLLAASRRSAPRSSRLLYRPSLVRSIVHDLPSPPGDSPEHFCITLKYEPWWCLKAIETRKPLASNSLPMSSPLRRRVREVLPWTRTCPASAARTTDCPDHGKRGLGNLTVCARYGKHKQHRLLYCRTCRYRFSERKGTPLFGSQLTEEQGGRRSSSTSPSATASGPPPGW